MAQHRKSKAIKYGVVLVVAVIAALGALYGKRGAGPVTYTRLLMGTVVEITVHGGDEEKADGAARAAFEEIARLEKIFSSYKKESEVSRINAAAGGAPAAVSEEVLRVVEAAVRVSELSGGAFDPTVGALAGLWGFSGEAGQAPDGREVEKALAFVNYKFIEVDNSTSTVGLKMRGAVLNLGGIAKGFIAARAADVLKANGVTRSIIKAGGDMTVFDATGKGQDFIVGIRHPRDPEKLIGEAYLLNGAVSTSGDYERFFERDGVRYHHILDPRTGFPARGTMSVTIIADDPTVADGLSTAVFVMGPVKGMELIERLEGVEGVIMDAQGMITTSKGFKGKIYRQGVKKQGAKAS